MISYQVNVYFYKKFVSVWMSVVLFWDNGQFRGSRFHSTLWPTAINGERAQGSDDANETLIELN